MVPSRELRGTSVYLNMMIAAYEQAFKKIPSESKCDPSQVSTVFASAHGEIETMVVLLDMIAQGEVLSPMRFKTSVHNAAGGLLSIATQSKRYSTALAAGEDSFAAGLLQAWLKLDSGEEETVALIVGDDALPHPLDAQIQRQGKAMCLILKKTSHPASMGELSFEVLPQNVDAEATHTHCLDAAQGLIQGFETQTKAEARFANGTCVYTPQGGQAKNST